MGSLMVNIKNSTIGRNCSGKHSEFGASIGSKYVTAIFFLYDGIKKYQGFQSGCFMRNRTSYGNHAQCFVVKEQFSIVQLTGVLMIIFSIVIIQTKDRKKFSLHS